MLQIDAIKHLAETYTPQEVFAAITWQRGQYERFDGQQIVTDLSNHSHLWQSFLFTTALYAPDPRGAGFLNLLIYTLIHMATFPLDQRSDTLYLVAENQDIIVSQLLDLGKRWEASTVHVYDGINGQEDWDRRDWLKRKLQGELFNRNQEECDGILIRYGWR